MAILFEQLEKVCTNFHNALATLNRTSPDDVLYELLRSGLIQTFEYTWDAFVKAISRCLVEDLANSAQVKGMSYKQLMVEASNKGYVSDVDFWLQMRTLRNKTSHEYAEAHAVEVITIGNAFYSEVYNGIAVMKARHGTVSE